jgi:hypothetical protein
MREDIVEVQPAQVHRQERKRRHFLRHLLEMVVVMMLGMCILGAAFREFHILVFGTGFAAAWRDHVALAAFAMGFNMTLPMLLWMRYRGHSWERGGEMALAMNVPVLPLLVLYGLGAIPPAGVLAGQMMLMIPAMLVVMLYRKEEYAAPHHGAVHPRGRPPHPTGSPLDLQHVHT